MLIDQFLEDAIEARRRLHQRRRAVGDRRDDGAHRICRRAFGRRRHGDAAAHALGRHAERVRTATHALARELKVVGLMNVQFAIKDNQLYVLEVNPRASRTVPFVAKAIGVPLAKLAAKVMAGVKLKDLASLVSRRRSIGA